ncbi:MAG: hypothetical protein VCD33_18090, partial [Alphaproteobacteria bacterium]
MVSCATAFEQMPGDAMKPRSNQTPLLDRVDEPRDMRDLSVEELCQLADELRLETIDAVSE